MAKQTGRRDSARPRPLRIAAYVLLFGGVALIGTALASTATRLEAASDGLLLIGWPLFILGGVLKGLDWMSSYTAAAEGSWDHHVNKPSDRGEAGAPHARRRNGRLQLFGMGGDADNPRSVPPDANDLRAAHERAQPAPRPLQNAPQAAAPGAPSDKHAAADPRPEDLHARPAQAQTATKRQPEPEPAEAPGYLSRVDPGPDTVIEEFVGYEGQDRMLAVRETLPPSPASPPPRELAWPNPPRQAVDVSAAGNEVFLGKLMDDVMAKLGTAPEPQAADHERPPQPAAAQAVDAVSTPVTWSRQLLHAADHWRFAALVEKLYQQAGFATQLQAGQTMRGVVVLWLFSRHRPGMPASVVSCVHAPGGLLPQEEIIAVAELVKARGLPRGQLATTGQVDAAGQQLAAARSVHLMDTERLLQLITQRTAEQQRTLADRLA